jgi:hypothetical protein
MGKVLRGYARDKNGNLVLIGTMPVPINKDKCPPAARREKRRLSRPKPRIDYPLGLRNDFLCFL